MKDDDNRRIAELKNCRLIAEGLFGWRFEDYHNGGGFWHRKPYCKRKPHASSCDCGGTHYLPDFYRNEAANAMLRMELPKRAGYTIVISIAPNGYTMIDGLGIPAVRHPDCATAIVQAALKLIEEGKR